ncbi:MAG TPA: hypothetical protein VMF67_16350 [Rhizomicrobium sp.]|nr:hypothetical protein [Rhizomicrobium sp.]
MVMPDENESRDTSHRPIADGLPGGEDICDEIESYIRAKPLKAMIIALLVGIVVGKIVL